MSQGCWLDLCDFSCLNRWWSRSVRMLLLVQTCIMSQVLCKREVDEPYPWEAHEENCGVAKVWNTPIRDEMAEFGYPWKPSMISRLESRDFEVLVTTLHPDQPRNAPSRLLSLSSETALSRICLRSQATSYF